jgi:acyl-CoA synthetase (AMP-forming)/AMP-acid ligase II
MVTNNYSMTEAGTAFTYMPPEEIARRPGSVGIPVGAEVRIAGDDGSTLPAGEVGEILLKVGEHHREYYRDPDATARTWSGQWLHSGDLGMLDDDGYLYIRGRQKDMIIRGGNNVMAADVEAVLLEHPGVIDAAVVPVPHEVLGEDVGAAVVARAATDVDLDELRAFCAERLADYKVPRRLWLVDELPRNPTGKVVKREITVPEPRSR